MSDFDFHINSPSFDDNNFKDASTSIEDLPCRITSIANSSVTVLNISGRTYSKYFDRHNNTPEKEDTDSSSATSSEKALKKMKFGTRYPLKYLDHCDLDASDIISETSPPTSSRCKSTPESLLRKHVKEASNQDKNPRCKTNIFKARKSFDKNNLCTSNKRTGTQYLRFDSNEVDRSTKPPINPKIKQSTKSPDSQNVSQSTKSPASQNVSQSTKSPINQIVNQKSDQKYIKHPFTDTYLQDFKKKKIKTTIDAAFKTSRTLVESRTTTPIAGTTFSDMEKLDFIMPEKVSANHSTDWKSNQGTCSSASIELFDKTLNAQDKFKLKVRKAKTKMEYLSRNCKFLHLREPEMKKPLLILDLDSLLIPFELPAEDLSKHKLEISRLIHSMYSYFNIAIWSASSMNILVSRLKYLDVFDEDKVTKIIFCLDCTSTITAFVPVVGNSIVKSPEVIWNLYPQFNQKNTIMINEDLKKYVLKQYGIPVGKHKEEKLIKYSELATISNFLANLITSTRSFSNLNIQSWKKPWK